MLEAISICLHIFFVISREKEKKKKEMSMEKSV